jgi:hypothetical protein
MRRTVAFVTVAFVVGLGAGYFARSARIGTAQIPDRHTADLTAIEKLHKKNIEVAKWTDMAAVVAGILDKKAGEI